ncbi:YsnF/AvaK domain-containing protein [Pontibacter arcticus]|uniref:DUF2382 domain-containing protein n=1 Tax=Pontibacter arcticus TaxID=2080288 RepID=A0A364RFH6_9BACT|nr:YsnF/AvaK domain-containing protein [Pontibacter arcticus]RAU83034.1 hypothetical protein DP923_07310 [Pontibacter arcticus]
MTQTVIGIFEKGIDAQTAVQKLESSSISRQNIDIANPSATSDRVQSGTVENTDGVSNFFSNLFGGNDDAKKHTEVARRGWVVTVHANTKQEAERVAEILDNSGAVDVDERAQQYMGQSTTAQGTDMTSRQTTQTPGNTNQRGGSDMSIPIIEENMQVGKRQVETGGARIRSRIIEKPVQENMRLREEHINIERNAVNRPATDKDFANFKEGELNITEHKEVPIVNKEARVVEEIRVNKTTEEHNETVRGTVRKTDVQVDKTNPTNSDNTGRTDTTGRPENMPPRKPGENI